MTRTFLCDVDGVLADFCAAIDRVAAKINYYEKIIWDGYLLEEVVPRDKARLIRSLACAPGFAWSIPEIPGACDAVREAMEKGIDIVFVTSPFSRSPTWVHDREAWLHERFGHHISMVFTNEKHRVAGDAICDDLADHITRSSASYKYLVRQPYNRNHHPPDTYVVSSVKEALENYAHATK